MSQDAQKKSSQRAESVLRTALSGLADNDQPAAAEANSGAWPPGTASPAVSVLVPRRKVPAAVVPSPCASAAPAILCPATFAELDVQLRSARWELDHGEDIGSSDSRSDADGSDADEERMSAAACDPSAAVAERRNVPKQPRAEGTPSRTFAAAGTKRRRSGSKKARSRSTRSRAAVSSETSPSPSRCPWRARPLAHAVR